MERTGEGGLKSGDGLERELDDDLCADILF